MMNTFTFSDTLSIAGISISLLFGILGIFLSLRRAKYPARITFIHEQTVALLDDFATRIPNLAVLYQDTPVEKSVVLLSGYLVNDGGIDITPQMTERPLRCELPGGCSWLEFKLTGAAEALTATGEITNSQTLELRFGLFRRDEAFSFQALALVDIEYFNGKPKTLAENLRWAHRIAGLGTIKTTKIPDPDSRPKQQRWVRKSVYITTAAFYLFLGLSMAAGLGPLGRNATIVYERLENGKVSTVRLNPNRDGTATAIDLLTGYERNVDLTEYTNSAMMRPIVREIPGPEGLRTLMGLLTVFMSSFMFYTAFAKDYKRYKLQNKVSAVARKT